jgi:hypothetical protein
MNPLNKIIFIQKVIEYGLPRKINNILLNQIEKYFNVNKNWEETIINYSDNVLEKDKKIWFMIVYHIKSDKFWEIIS